MTVEEIIRDLDRVARKNKDRWGYRFNLRLPHASTAQPLRWEFECYEEAEGHTMVAAHGFTAEEAAQKAHAQLPGALKDWGYSV